MHQLCGEISSGEELGKKDQKVSMEPIPAEISTKYDLQVAATLIITFTGVKLKSSIHWSLCRLTTRRALCFGKRTFVVV